MSWKGTATKMAAAYAAGKIIENMSMDDVRNLKERASYLANNVSPDMLRDGAITQLDRVLSQVGLMRSATAPNMPMAFGSGFVMGIAAGVGGALLLAPTSGAELRARISDWLGSALTSDQDEVEEAEYEEEETAQTESPAQEQPELN